MEKSIIIIGAGLTGLSAGCYGRMNGYKTTIFEMHDIPGGVCTAWKRKGYTIDGAVNWIIGTKPGTGLHRFWEEVGAAQGWKIYNHDLYMTVEDREGKAFNFYCDADRFEKYLLEIAPEDRETIREFTGAVRRSAKMDMPVDKPEELYGLLDALKMTGMLSTLRFMKKWSRITVGEFTARFKNPFLREMFPRVLEPDWPMFGLIWMLGYQHARAAGYIIGGALPLAKSIEKRYLDLGGEVHYKARVEKILVENGRAVGVRLSDGSEHRAGWVVSAADGRTTIFDMLDGKYAGDDIRKKYDNPRLFKPLVYIGLGVNRTLDDLPASVSGISYPLDKPVNVAGRDEKTLYVRSYCFDPTLAPEGKNLLVVQWETDFDYWKKLSQDPERYKAEKERIANEAIAGLEQRFPGISSQVEMVDVATPVTWERYTGNWRGAYEGWQFDADSFASSMKKTLPGLYGFYMAGQWVNPGGGMPTAIMSGNHTIQLICKKDGKKFTTSRP